MTTYEDLLNEAYKEGITVKEKPLKYSDGRIKGNKIAIRKSIETDKEKACILAEELGHYYTTVGNILDQNDSNNRRQELIARKWAYEKILPIENILFAVQDGHTEIWDMAEYLDVDEKFLKRCPEMLRDSGHLNKK